MTIPPFFFHTRNKELNETKEEIKMRHSNENKKKREILSSRGIRYCIPSKSKTHQLEIRQKKKYTTYFPSFETTESHLFYLILSIIFSITFLEKKRLENLLYRSVFFFSYTFVVPLYPFFPFFLHHLILV